MKVPVFALEWSQLSTKPKRNSAKGVTLYCLGDIVHNSREVERLKEMGLITINHEEFKQLHNAKVLLRAMANHPRPISLPKKIISKSSMPRVRWYSACKNESNKSICRRTSTKNKS